MATRLIAGLLLASASTNVLADNCCRQQMVTGFNGLTFILSFKDNLLQAPSLWTECTPCLRKGLSLIWLHRTKTSARCKLEGKKSQFIVKIKRMGVCMHGQARPARRNTVSQVQPLFHLLHQAFCFSVSVLFSTESSFCRKPHCCRFLQVTLFGSSPQ